MVTQMDQLRWVALRHLLAGSVVAPPAAAEMELDDLDIAQALKACVFSGFLSHMVPAPDVTVDLSGDESAEPELVRHRRRAVAGTHHIAPA